MSWTGSIHNIKEGCCSSLETSNAPVLRSILTRVYDGAMVVLPFPVSRYSRARVFLCCCGNRQDADERSPQTVGGVGFIWFSRRARRTIPSYSEDVIGQPMTHLRNALPLSTRTLSSFGAAREAHTHSLLSTVRFFQTSKVTTMKSAFLAAVLALLSVTSTDAFVAGSVKLPVRTAASRTGGRNIITYMTHHDIRHPVHEMRIRSCYCARS